MRTTSFDISYEGSCSQARVIENVLAQDIDRQLARLFKLYVSDNADNFDPDDEDEADKLNCTDTDEGWLSFLSDVRIDPTTYSGTKSNVMRKLST